MRLARKMSTLTLLAGLLCGCATETATGPMRMDARPLNLPHSRANDFAIGGSYCNIEGVACGHLSIDVVGTETNPLEWDVFASTWFNKSTDVGRVMVAGQALLYKDGAENFDYSLQAALACDDGRDPPRVNSCGDMAAFYPNCASQANRLWAHTTHTVVTIAGKPYFNTAEQEKSCQGPAEGCDGGGGGDGGGGDSLQTLRRPSNRPHFYCDPGSGGDSDYGEHCESGHLWIEISYDGGETWSLLWEDDVIVCEEIE